MTARLSTGVHGLDAMLHGGLLRGRNILLSGPCGVGKTTLAMHFLVSGARASERVLYVTFEESKEKIFADMQSLGFELDEFARDGRLQIIGGAVSSVSKIMARFDASVEHLIRELDIVIRENKVTRIVIDSVNLLLMLVEGDHNRRKALAILCNTLSATGVTAILISEVSESSMGLSTYGLEEFIVDGVITLNRIVQGNKVLPGISVRKLRGSNHDREQRLYRISSAGVVVFDEEPFFNDS